MGAVLVLGGSFGGVAAAVRLARAGHEVTLAVEDPAWPDALQAALDGDPAIGSGATPGTLDFPAPWRDLFTKSGRPAAGALGLHGLSLIPDACGPPTDRGEQWRHDEADLGEEAANRWRDLVDDGADTWLALRPLGLESEITPDAVARARLDPRRTLGDVARAAGHPVLAERVRAVATTRGLHPDAAPAWLTSRLAVTRTFGRWRLVDACGSPRPASALVDVLLDRLADRGVRVVPTNPANPTTPATPPNPTPIPTPDVTIDATDPHLTWHRPSRWRRNDSLVDQLLARPATRVPGRPDAFNASASGPGGTEPWAQLLGGALAAYAAHERLTGLDIRPTNRAGGR